MVPNQTIGRSDKAPVRGPNLAERIMLSSRIRSLVAPCRRRVGALIRPLLPPPPIRKSVLQPDDRTLYVPHGDGAASAASSGPESGRLSSCLCTAEQLESEAFRAWSRRIGREFAYHRKLWEFCYICQALSERGLLAPGNKGLGFAVGQEPLPALFAAMGCRILATDLDAADPRAEAWSSTNQWAASAAALNQNALCDAELFRERVSFRPVDMNRIPNELTGFDFTWSSCSFEHCGSIELGKEFVLRQMKCLKPGGVAVHTTEFNLTSNRHTITSGPTVVFRRCDIEDLVRRLIDEGHSVAPLDLSVGRHRHNRLVDKPPYASPVHLRLQLGRYAATSIGLIITRNAAAQAEPGNGEFRPAA